MYLTPKTEAMLNTQISFGDKRLERRCKKILQAFTDSSHCVINKLFNNWSDIYGAYRFLRNESVSEQKLSDNLSLNCKAKAAGKNVLALCDTTEFNVHNHKNRISDFDGLGMTTDNRCVGFYLHGILGVDANSRIPLGWAKAHMFNRPMDNKPFTEPNGNRAIEEKESNKWLGPSIYSRDEVFNKAKHVIFIMDREGDIFEVLDRLPNAKADVLIRSKHNRKCYKNGERCEMLLHDMIRSEEHKGEIKVKIPGNKKRKARQSNLLVRYGSCEIKRPIKIKFAEQYSNYVEISYVHIIEKNKKQENGEAPIEWFLITSQKVSSLKKAIEIVRNYRIRWDIEEMFRLLKTEGFNIESTELESGRSIRKITLISMEAAIKIKQLKAARDGVTDIKIEEVFNEIEIQCLEQLNKEYKGTTEKQSNPYEERSLPWASWIIARIGGWKGYKSQRPPGTITFKTGYEKFQILFMGYSMRFS